MIKIIISTFIISIVSLNFVLSDETKLPPSQFQTSLGGSQQMLSVRHKMIGVKERPYKATFVVHNTDNEETYYSDLIVKGSNWGRVIFPDDFKNLDGSKLSFYSDGGNFIWNCIVEGDVVIDGEFSFSSKLIGETKHDLRELIEKYD